MNDRQYISYGKKKKTKTFLIIICAVSAVILVAAGAVGIIAGSDSEERMAVSAAVEENTELKQQMSVMQGTIDELNIRIDELEKELESRPTVSPTPYAGQTKTSPSPSPSVQTVPRERVKN